MNEVDNAILDALAEGDKYAEVLFKAVKELTSRPTFYRRVAKMVKDGMVERKEYGSAVQYRFVEPVPGFLEALRRLEARIPDINQELLGAGNLGAMESVMKEVLGPSFLLVFLSIGEEGRESLLAPYLRRYSRKEIDAMRESQAKVQHWMDWVGGIVMKRIAPVWKKVTQESILAALHKLSPEIAQILARVERG